MVVILQGGIIREKVVVFGQKWLYSGKCGCILIKVVVLLKNGSIQAKEVVIGKKWL